MKNPKVSNKGNKKYSYIYQELVNDDDDLVGMIAYALYKSEKVKYIKKITSEREEVTESEIENYNIASKIRIKDYEEKALTLFTDFIDDVIDRKVKMSREVIQEAIEKTASPKGFINWARSITQSFIGAVIYTIFISVILLIVWFNNSGEKQRTEKLIIDKAKTELHIITPSDTTETQAQNKGS
jgi:hypothetical protein